jgi:hypothetical protein
VGDTAAAHAGIGREVVGSGHLDLHVVHRQAEDFGHDLAKHEVGAGTVPRAIRNLTRPSAPSARRYS